MTEYEKVELYKEIEFFFKEARNEMGHPVPYSEQGIKDTLDRVGWEYIKEHWFNAMEEDGDKSIEVIFEFHHQVVLEEVNTIALELEKEGILESGIDENGEVTFIHKE